MSTNPNEKRVCLNVIDYDDLKIIFRLSIEDVQEINDLGVLPCA